MNVKFAIDYWSMFKLHESEQLIYKNENKEINNTN